MRVLIADPIAPDGAEILGARGVEADTRIGLKEDELIAAIGDYDGLIVRSETKVTPGVLTAAKKLQVVGRAGVGYDNIDIDAATGHGVIVVNAPSSNTISAAEHTLAMMLSVARHVPQAHSSLAGGEWNRREFLGTELRGKTLGIVGLGRIGSEVARRAAAFEMRILGYDPFVAEEHGRHLGAEIVTLPALFERSDIITLHTPMTDSTRRLIGEPELSQMKKGAILINCARGGLVDEDALRNAIEEDRIGGAALDVFITEPPEDSPLFQHPNVVVTPHLGASTEEAQSNVAREVAEQMIDVFEGRAPRYAVNAPLIPPETAAELAPYVPLALVVGRLASQLTDGQPERLSISFRGAVGELATDILAATVLSGFLQTGTETRINIVNAGTEAQRRGIHVQQSKDADQTPPYTNLVNLDVHTTASETTVGATLTERGQTEIVQVNGYQVGIIPTGGHWMIIGHTDRPGMLGRIGTVTGENNINIASLHVSRESMRGPALTVVNVDESPEEQHIAAILGIDGVDTVRVVNL